MPIVVLTAFLIASIGQVSDRVLFEVASLQRKDLPRDFPFQVFQEGFAVLRVRVRNETAGVFGLDPELIEVVNAKGKKISKAALTEITPKLMKYHRGNYRDIHSEAYVGIPSPNVPPGSQSTTTIERSSTGRTVPAGKAAELTNRLETYMLKRVDLAPGESSEGFIYLKSKKSGKALAGGAILLGGQRIQF